MKVKICGITDVEDAKYLASLGVDYMGLIFAKSSKRFVSADQAKDIILATKETKMVPVAVFKDHTAEQINFICEKTQITTIQLHGKVSKSELHKLKEKYTIFYATTFDDLESLPNCDYILFDNPNPGSGQEVDYQDKVFPQSKNCILAGGLTPKNVAEAIKLLNPHIVDVATGVEYSNSSRKDPQLVKEFVKAAKKEIISFQFGGRFIPEILVNPIKDLEKEWNILKHDQSFKDELHDLLSTFAGRSTPLSEVKNFAKAIDGPRVFLKREDLLHTGAHKINNAIGQCLIAKRLGKTRIIAETGAGQHGIAVATACARLGLKCVVYMGAIDIERQKVNVEKMLILGAEVVSVTSGGATLKSAVNEALRDWSSSYENSHYCIGSAVGPDPFPSIVREFQSVISFELKKQLQSQEIYLPDMLIACVGGGSNAIGFFHHFVEDNGVKLIGVEAGGKGDSIGQHAARFKSGTPGVFHGFYSYFLQDCNGQIAPTHSISAGLDYPGVGPDHAKFHLLKRANYFSVTDEEALQAFHLLSKTEGIIPALESSHALAYLMKVAPNLDKSSVVVVNLSGRGDKDIAQIVKQKGRE